MVATRTAKNASSLRAPRRSRNSRKNVSTPVISTPAQSGTAPPLSRRMAIAEPMTS